MADHLKINIAGDGSVSGLWDSPDDVSAVLVLAHGAGAGMTHPFMDAVAHGLYERRIATLRFQFPFMERGSKRPDVPAVARSAIRAAVDTATELAPELPLFVGGKSFGARMASQAQAAGALPPIVGLVFFGFPLHPAKKPAISRAAHLAEVGVPMLFLQGTRDALADVALMHGVVQQLGQTATLIEVDGADHAFHVPKRSGHTDEEVLASMLDATKAWIAEQLARP